MHRDTYLCTDLHLLKAVAGSTVIAILADKHGRMILNYLPPIPENPARASRRQNGAVLPQGHWLIRREDSIVEYLWGGKGIDILCVNAHTPTSTEQMFGDVGGYILDIKVVGSHHLALRRCATLPNRGK